MGCTLGKMPRAGWGAFSTADSADSTGLGRGLHWPAAQAIGLWNFTGILLRVGGKRQFQSQHQDKAEESKRKPRRMRGRERRTTKHGLREPPSRVRGRTPSCKTAVNRFAHFQNTIFGGACHASDRRCELHLGGDLLQTLGVKRGKGKRKKKKIPHTRAHTDGKYRNELTCSI